ncbi:MAG: hypothetical protein PHO92_04475 [Candidatus Peribacteraceae bacterium]|nr:hypothetical protein [Candidatus Peribacteraceae bacterium]
MIDSTFTETCLQYSGATAPGMNTQASYDRMIWDGSAELHEDPESTAALLQDCLHAFRDSARSRLLIRTNVRGAGAALPDRAALALHPGETLEAALYPNGREGAYHLTVGLNAPERAVAPDALSRMQQSVRSDVQRVTQLLQAHGSFDRYALAQLERVRAEGMAFDTHASSRDLVSLWQHPFCWTPEQCAAYAAKQDATEQVFLLRDAHGRAISGALFSGGESTEWATLPERQGKGYIVPLLLYANCTLIRQGVRSVFVEARWDRSISPGLKSGFVLSPQPFHQWMLSNHVTVGDQPDIDPPDAWNGGRGRLSDGTDAAMLRSFAVIRLDPSLFTEDVLDSYLSSRCTS